MPIIPSFDELAAQETRLAELLAEARSCSSDGDTNFCASTVWYGRAGTNPGLLERLLALVSPESGRQGLLGTYLAFAVAYDTLSEALPACRGVCACAASRPAGVPIPGTPTGPLSLGAPARLCGAMVREVLA